MSDHGIIMSAPMVLALLAGRKTVTRRTSDVCLALFREINGDEVPDRLWRIEFRRVERDNA